ncbi:Acetylcholine receptor subunit beta-like 1 [Folsomia candida]|uniref:Acetylcholine receptor subunit beta-like 1 n=1 Tax=Folsomia candida TaxID=158441 RepID=A0A226DT47_FOLCA|nr:Acetylcholine receptor subunit beta-like 1 [Folsomia candida]
MKTNLAKGEPSEKLSTVDHAAIAVRDQLLKNLFDSYKKENYAENTTVHFGITPADVIFDTENNVMDSRVWLQISWIDTRFIWNETEFPVSVLRVPAEKMWRPDISLYNGPKPSMDCYATNALVYPNGKVWWEPACRLQTYCSLTLTNAPYDEQICNMRFSGGTLDGFTMGLELWKEGNVRPRY